MLKLNAGSVATYNNAREYVVTCWKNVERVDSKIVEMYQGLRDYVMSLDCSSDNPNEDEIDAGHAAILHELNLRLQREAFTSSHKPATIESSNNTKQIEETTMSNATAVTTTSFDIESMSINELAELQLKIAQRMAELLAAPAVEAPKSELTKADPVAAAPVVEAKPKRSASRVSKKAAAEAVIAEVISTPPTKTAKEPVAAKAMTYKELQSEISRICKASVEAKAIAAKYAKECGKKSWSTTGAAGYAAIHEMVKHLA